MDFKAATDRMTATITLADLSAEMGTSNATVRQARLDPRGSSYRTPPAGWEKAIAKLALERAAELVRLAKELEK